MPTKSSAASPGGAVYCAVTFAFAAGLVSLTVRLQLIWSLTSADERGPPGSEKRVARDEPALGVWPLHPKAAARLKKMKDTPFVFPNVFRLFCCIMSLRLSVFGLGSGVPFRLIGGRGDSSRAEEGTLRHSSGTSSKCYVGRFQISAVNWTAELDSRRSRELRCHDRDGRILTPRTRRPHPWGQMHFAVPKCNCSGASPLQTARMASRRGVRARLTLLRRPGAVEAAA